jgi:hypothetical protein
MKTLARYEDTAELLRRLRLVRPDSERRWGRMNAHQMLCHCADAMRAMTGQILVSHDAPLFNRTILKWAALWVPYPWKEGLRTRPELDQHEGGTPPGDFEADLREVERQIEIFTAAVKRGDLEPHPVFGPLSSAAWLRWGHLHVDHHLKQFGI